MPNKACGMEEADTMSQLTEPIPPAHQAHLIRSFDSDEQCSEFYRYQEIEAINPALQSLSWERQAEVVFALKVIENAGYKRGTQDWVNERRDRESASIAERILARYGLDLNGQFFDEVNE